MGREEREYSVDQSGVRLLGRRQSLIAAYVNRGKSALTAGMIGMIFCTRSRHAVFPIHRINLWWARANARSLRLTDHLRSGAIFEHVQRSPPTFPTMPLHCRSLPISLRSLPFNSHLIPIGSDFQIGFDRQRIVAQWNGGIKLFVHAVAELEIKDTIRTVFNNLSAQHCSDVIMSTMASQITGDGLLNRLFRRISKKTSTHRVTGLCERNSPVRWIPLTKGQ